MLSESFINKITRLVDNRKNSIIEFLQALIRIPSVVGKEKDCILFCAKKLEKMEFQIDLWEPDIKDLKNHPAYNSSSETNYENRPNLVGVLKGTGEGRSILLNGHIDVVPPGPLDLWKHDPWSGTIKDDKIFGRGTADMKGGIAAMIKAIEFLQIIGIRLKGDVIIECVVDEEGGGNGTLASIIRGYRADAGVITEPWGIKNLAIGHRGSLGFRITTEGRVAPVDKKAHGVSAIEKMQIVLEALQELKMMRQETVTHPLYAEYENSVPIIVGTIQGGSWLTSVPLRCVIEGFLGWLPNELLDNIQKNFREYIYKVSISDPWLKENPPKVEFPSLRIEPCQLDSNHPIIKTVKDSAKSISRQDIKLIFVNAGADQWLLNLYGGTPTVQFGPGGGNAHSPDEFIYISELINSTKILALTLMEWCGVK